MVTVIVIVLTVILALFILYLVVMRFTTIYITKTLEKYKHQEGNPYWFLIQAYQAYPEIILNCFGMLQNQKVPALIHRIQLDCAVKFIVKSANVNSYFASCYILDVFNVLNDLKTRGQGYK